MYEVASVPFAAMKSRVLGDFNSSYSWRSPVKPLESSCFHNSKKWHQHNCQGFLLGRPMFEGTIPGRLLKSNPEGRRASSSTWTAIFIMRSKIWCNNKPPKGNRLCNQAAIELFGTLHLRTHGQKHVSTAELCLVSC